MPLSKNKSWYCDRKKKRLSQGDIIRELNLTISSSIGNAGDFSLSPSFSYGVVLSQECDLEQHYELVSKNKKEEEEKRSDDKVVETILICPAFPADQFLLGEHISGKRMSDFGGSLKKLEKLKNNDEYNRYHYLPSEKEKFPELIIDFKRFYTVPLGVFDRKFKKFYIISINNLYRERLSQRFANYLGRIGLPEQSSKKVLPK